VPLTEFLPVLGDCRTHRRVPEGVQPLVGAIIKGAPRTLLAAARLLGRRRADLAHAATETRSR
jgi:hypothetical protein